MHDDFLDQEGPGLLSSADWQAVAIGIEDGVASADVMESELRRIGYL
jgi:hypothetical protein